MKLMVQLSRIEDLDSVLKLPIEGVILPIQNVSHRVESPLSMDAFDDAVARVKKADKKCWFNANRVFHEPDLAALDEVMQWLNLSPVDGLLFADLAVLAMAQRLNLEPLCCYHPETYVTSLEDTQFWFDRGIKRIILSRELPLDDLTQIASKAQAHIGFVGHGYINLFHSKRPLLKHHGEQTQTPGVSDADFGSLKLKENQRTDLYPIFEDASGTHIFRPKPRASFQVLKTLAEVLDFFIIDGLMLDQTTLVNTIKDYIEALQSDDLEPFIKKYQNKTDDGLYTPFTHASKGSADHD